MAKRQDIPFFKPSIGLAEVREVTRVLQSGWLTTGKRCQKFERAFAKYVGAKHALALNSCTAALHLGLEAIGLGEGDVVVVPTMTFAATAEAVHYLRGVPVLVDSERRSLCMQPAAARCTLEALGRGEPVPGLKRTTSRQAGALADAHRKRKRRGGLRLRRRDPGRLTKGFETRFGTVRAIIPVHYGGQMADVGAFRDLAKQYDLYLIKMPLTRFRQPIARHRPRRGFPLAQPAISRVFPSTPTRRLRPEKAEWP